MEIITEGWPEENGEQILLAEATIKYWQNPDCTEGQDGEPQEITISTRDNGVAKFLNIKTENWSIDDIESLEFLINDFKKRIDYK